MNFPTLSILACSTILASTFAAQGHADIKPSPPNSDRDPVPVVKKVLGADVKTWDVVVFKSPDPASPSYIKRLVGLPGEMLVLHDEERRQPKQTFETIKTQGAKIEITEGTIRIEGGTVEIRRSAP